MAKVKWFKIIADIFDDQKIRAIEMLPDGDTIIVIWFKLLALAATSNNNGIVMFTETIPYTEDLLIPYLGKKETTTRLAFETFKKWGMLESLDEEQLLISNWNKYQNVNGLDKIREQNRLRQQKYRNKQKNLLENKEKKEEIKTNNNLIDRDNALHNVTNNVTYDLFSEYDTAYLFSVKEIKTFNLFSESVNEAFIDLLLYRPKAKQKAPNTKRAIQGIINKLIKLDDDDKLYYINEAIERGWVTIFPKEEKKQETLKFTN